MYNLGYATQSKEEKIVNNDMPEVGSKRLIIEGYIHDMEEFKKRIKEKEDEIKASGLESVNPILYKDLLKQIRDLRLGIMSLKDKNVTNKDTDLISTFSSVGAVFDFYMEEFGNREIATLHFNEITEKLENIYGRLTADNYLALEDEFNEALKLYDGKIKNVVDVSKLEDLIVKFRYQLFLHKLREHIVDDKLSINCLLVMLASDIDAILADPEVSDAIKEELEKYAFDIDLIRDKLQTVLALVNLGLHQKDANAEDVAEELSAQYHYASQIQKEYYKNEELKTKLTQTKGITEIYLGHKAKFEEYIPEAIAIYARREGFNIFDVFDTLHRCEFKSVKCLIEALITNGIYSEVDTLGSIIRAEYPQYIDSFDRALITLRNDIPMNRLHNFIIMTGNDFFFNWLYQNGQDEELMKLFTFLPASMQRKLLERKLSKATTDAEKQAILLSFMKEEVCKIRKDIIIKLLEYKQAKLIIEALDALILLKRDNLKEELMSLLALIEDEKIKAEVLDYYFEQTKNPYSNAAKLLSVSLVNNMCLKRDSQEHSEIDTYNVLEIYQYSRIVEEGNVLYFVQKYYKEKLDWEHILESAFKLDDEDYFTVIMYCYLGARDYFINNVDLSLRSLIPFLLNHIPESIIDIIVCLSPLQMAELDSNVLEIFATSYEQKMAQENQNLNDKMDFVICSNYKPAETKELLAYIMHRGLLNPMFMFHFKQELFSQDGAAELAPGSPVMIRALNNISDKTQKVGLFAEALNGRPFSPMPEDVLYLARKMNVLREDFNFDTIFLSEKDLEDIKNDYTQDEGLKIARIQKYYSELLKIMPLVPLDIQMRIALQIARSGIVEYMLYIKSNYPNYAPIILSHVTDGETYDILSNFEGTYSLEDALNFVPIAGARS